MSKESKKHQPITPVPTGNDAPGTQTTSTYYLPIIIVLFVIFIIGLMFSIMQSHWSPTAPNSQGTAIQENGRQIISVIARGGYTPSIIRAQADVPTTLRLKTSNTFDCSASFTIPTLGISRVLPMNGDTDIEIPPQHTGTTLTGICAMGMYSFKMIFS